MGKKRHTTEEIVMKLREADVLQSKGQTVLEACRQIEISEQTYYNWRKEYGGLKIDQAKRFKQMEQENGRLKRLVADLSMDNAILKEAARGNY